MILSAYVAFKLTVLILLCSDPNAPVARNAKSLTESDIVGEDREEKSVKLFDATLEAASNFMSTHNLEVKFPTEVTSNFARSIEEGKSNAMLVVNLKLITNLARSL